MKYTGISNISGNLNNKWFKEHTKLKGFDTLFESIIDNYITVLIIILIKTYDALLREYIN